MRTKGLSIIIPCFNSGIYILDAVNSILNQKFKYNYEIIIVDDASDDYETLKALNYIKDLKNIKIIKFSFNKGVQTSRNEGINHAKYEYILQLDSDDCLNTQLNIIKFGTYGDRAIEILDERPDVAFVHCITEMFGEFNGYTLCSYPLTVSQILNKHHVLIGIIFRKEDAIKAGLYNIYIEKWQDWSFAISLLNSRYIEGKENNIYFLDKPYYLYRIHSKLDRISFRNILEKDMVVITVKQNIHIFSSIFHSRNVDEITNKIMKNKPNNLLKLLYIASNNIDIAIKIINERSYELESKLSLNNVQ